MVPYGRRLKYAFRTFFSILDHSRIPDDVADALLKKEAPAPASIAPAALPVDRGDRAVQILALLQRDGRLVDFLMEDLTPYQDAQIGAAVRDVHGGSRQALQRYFTLEPVMDDEEGRPVAIERGTDPARLKVTGNAAAAPPLRGTLRHRGWEVTRVELPPLPGSGRTIVAPAEVEVS
jgi:Domain of unknown function (DUF2760)